MQRRRWCGVAFSGAVAVLLATMGQAKAEYVLEQVHPSWSYSGSLTAVGSQLFYEYSDILQSRSEIWTSDGTTAGTHMVLDLQPEPWGWSEGIMAPFAGRDLFYFAAGVTDATLDTRQLWRSDGTVEGTFPLTLIPDHPNSPHCIPMAMVGDELLFACTDREGGTGREIWKSDGTLEGTSMVIDMNPGPAGHNPRDPVLYKGEMYYAGFGDLGSQLYKTDGTAEGTVRVSEGLPPSTTLLQPNSLTVVGDKLFFEGRPVVSDLYGELFCTDGTAAGLYLVKAIIQGEIDTYSYPGRAMAAVGDTLFFMPNDGVHGVELWVSDGTEEGTRLVKDVAPGEEWSTDTSPEIAEFQGQCIAVLDDGTNGLQLWVSDGTADGTVSLAGLYHLDDGRERTVGESIQRVGDLVLLQMGCAWYEDGRRQTGVEVWLGDLDGMERIWTGRMAGSSSAARVGDTVYVGLTALDGTEGGLYRIVVPEPATLSLLALGGLAMVHKRRRR